MSTSENLSQAEQSSLDLKIRKYAFALGVTNALIVYGFFFISGWCFYSPQCVQFDFVSKHYLIFLAMPIAAFAAAFVALLRTVDGQIKFKCIGFEFEGAAGQIVMFILVFLGFVLAFSVLRNG